MDKLEKQLTEIFSECKRIEDCYFTNKEILKLLDKVCSKRIDEIMEEESEWKTSI